MRLASLVLLLLPAAALAEADTRVSADRVEGVPEETGTVFHEGGLEVFAFLTVTPVTVTVRRLDGTDWTDGDAADAARQVATCPAEGPHRLTQETDGPVLLLTFTCSSMS
ncbi:hypothetical protein [Wenxinia marina]|uniref:Gram-negative bacterial tonB protein n=1 Tax=Wenxinia marina DSM 24838 TaxID=1123501 RepID=A0A0D0PEQ4_9RHOB|nr:hypothetical protein [Wenxinia marina]KIQ69881.1 hypothetical protein Wenmar_01451 [Wenxinia marina DSM 24838]GGL61959.1 hypothetical protein GCM10011392_15550 [Wenxinia marina]